jgi:hypothetical protein
MPAMKSGLSMNRQDAEEYTLSLGQIIAGSWRQIALAQKLGVPKPQPPDPQLLGLLDPKVSLEQAQCKLLERRRDGAAASTVEALMFGLRDGIDALPTKPERLRRLSELSETQLHEVCARLQNFKPQIATAWTPGEVQALVSIWSKIHVTR